MTKTVAVLDYGSGNVHSALKAVAAAGAAVKLTADSDEVLAADGLLVPGVGAFAAVVDQLKSIGGEQLIAAKLAAGKKVLGICVGQQILFAGGVERGVEAAGLGYFSGAVAPLEVKTLPHMGWNSVEPPAKSILFQGLKAKDFYFVHSNAAVSQPEALQPELTGSDVQVTWAEHEGQKFVAALEAGPLSAAQFHPEKSAKAGVQLLANWVQSL